MIATADLVLFAIFFGIGHLRGDAIGCGRTASVFIRFGSS
jgi:hypothetical protein